MSEARTEQQLALLEPWLDSRVEVRERLARRQRRMARAWSTNMINKAVCCATIALLSPAIFAVWVAIKRSAPQKSVIGHERRAETGKDQPNVLLSIKPIALRVPPIAAKSKIGVNRAISA
jgi:hypothetical protein